LIAKQIGAMTTDTIKYTIKYTNEELLSNVFTSVHQVGAHGTGVSPERLVKGK
jgi:hypothetical protein